MEQDLLQIWKEIVEICIDMGDAGFNQMENMYFLWRYERFLTEYAYKKIIQPQQNTRGQSKNVSNRIRLLLQNYGEILQKYSQEQLVVKQIEFKLDGEPVELTLKQDNDECPICMEEAFQWFSFCGQQNHFLCGACSQSIKKKNCPYCRREVEQVTAMRQTTYKRKAQKDVYIQFRQITEFYFEQRYQALKLQHQSIIDQYDCIFEGKGQIKLPKKTTGKNLKDQFQVMQDEMQKQINEWYVQKQNKIQDEYEQNYWEQQWCELNNYQI